MADINLAFDAVIKPYEGFYSNIKEDGGGETLYGYARSKNSAAPVWTIVDGYKRKSWFPDNMRNDHSLLNMIIQLYKLNYWDKMRLDEVKSQAVANELFDTTVNCGPSVAAKFLQRALNVFNKKGALYPDLIVDGVAGPKTIATLNAFPYPDKILKALNALQGTYYITLCEIDPVKEKFMNGWIERVEF